MTATVWTNATVVTCDPQNTVADAVAFDEGRIVAVGREAEVRSSVGPGGEVVDLDGATVLPGLIDTHPHLMHFGALAEPLVDITDATSQREIAGRVARRAAEVAAGEWIMTTPVGEPHYFLRRSYRDLAEGTLPDRTTLDRAVPRHPVFIQAWAPVTPNLCAMNSMALERLGITRDTPDRVENVWVEKDEIGEPTGRLRGSVTNYYSDSEFMNDLLRRMPVLQGDALVPGTERAMQTANQLGVTTIYEGHLMAFSLIEVYRWMRNEGRLTTRVLCSPEAETFGVPWSEPPLDLDDYVARLARAEALVDHSDEMFRIDGVTVSRYGPCGPGFILMRDPYLGPYGETTTGRSFVSPDKIEAAVRYCDQHDLRLNVVTAGTAEGDHLLDQLEALKHRPATTDGRSWVLQNFYFADPDRVRRVAALGLDVTTSMSFSWGKGELVRQRFGEHLLEDLIPLARLAEAGIHVGCGTDWGPKNVFEQIALAVEPRYADGGPAKTDGVNPRQALAHWTDQAAHVLAWEGIGSLQPGHHADLVVVDRNPLRCRVEELAETQVIATVLAGEIVAGQLT